MVTITIENIGKRCRSVQSMLSPIRPFHGPERRPVQAVVTSYGRKAVVAALDKRLGPSPREWLFKTSVTDVWAQYSEEWIHATRSIWVLRQAGLNLFIARGPAETQREEIFALHCEPQEEGLSLESRCKQCPHVHVTADGNLLSHAHIPLHVLSRNQDLTSVKRFTDVFQKANEIIESEILKRIRES